VSPGCRKSEATSSSCCATSWSSTNNTFTNAETIYRNPRLDLALRMKVLVLNSGSSSQKSCLYDRGHAPLDPPRCTWEVRSSGSMARLSTRSGTPAELPRRLPSAGSRPQAIERLLQSLWSGDTQAISKPSEIDVVGHRVVHGVRRISSPALVTAKVKSAIEGVSVFAPSTIAPNFKAWRSPRNCWSSAAGRRFRYRLHHHMP